MLLTKNNAALRLLFEGGLLDHSKAEVPRQGHAMGPVVVAVSEIQPGPWDFALL